MSKKSKGGLFSFIILAGLITLAVTGLRLLGEIQEWPGFTGQAKEVGGPAFLGIVWLVPIFGLLFGRKLAANGTRPKSFARGAIPCVVAFVAFIGIFVVFFDEEREMLTEDGLTALMIGGPLLALLGGMLAWPAAFGANLFYGILARGPVIAVQYLAIAKDWGTHYEKLPDPTMTADERGFGLMMAQLVAWIPFTILVGGLFAAIGAATVKKK